MVYTVGRAYINDMAQDYELWKPHMRKAHIEAWSKMREKLPYIGGVPRVEWSNRLTKSAGLAYVEDGFIRLSSKLFWQYPEGFILEIVPHELAHIAAYHAFKDGGHGEGWKACMAMLEIPAHRCWEPARMRAHRVNFWKDK